MAGVCLLHPVSADTEAGVAENLARALRWFNWLVETRPDDYIIMNWYPYVVALDDKNPDHRKRGLRDSCRMIRSGAVQEVVVCGGRVSTGMAEELEVASVSRIKITDLSSLGEEPPEVVKVPPKKVTR